MPAEFGAPKQHKQPSRKSKRAWRKNVDISEVQDGLESLREEIIQTGSGPVSEQNSEALFAVDVAGNEDVRRKLKSTKPLKVDEILKKRSAIPAVDSRKRAGSNLGSGILEPASKRQKKDWVSKKDVQRLRQVAGTTSHLNGLKDDNEGQIIANDPWAEEDLTSAKQHASLEFIPQARSKVAPATIKRTPIPMTASGKSIRAIRNPDAGTSYNPDFEHWNDLLNREGEKEIAAEKKRLEKEAHEAEKQARIDAITNNDGHRPDDESVWEGFETDRSETAEALKAKRPHRKTPSQRNKINRKKEMGRQIKHETKMAMRQNQVLDLIKSNTEQSLEPAERSTETASDAEDEYSAKLRRRRLGPAAIPEQNLELVLPDELQESLRQLKPEGNLLQDRFRNLLVNGKIESRKPVLQPKKKKVKMTEKWSYKDFGVSV